MIVDSVSCSRSQTNVSWLLRIVRASWLADGDHDLCFLSEINVSSRCVKLE